jgi:hypothetical protein
MSSRANVEYMYGIVTAGESEAKKGAAAGLESNQKGSLSDELHRCSILLGCSNRGEGSLKSMQI